MLRDYEVPVAYSMVRNSASRATDFGRPFYEFACYWVAFNNIYVTLADRAGIVPRLRTDPEGAIRTREVAGVKVPLVSLPTEQDQIKVALACFTGDLKDKLIRHPSTHFFVYRIPRWEHSPIEYDRSRQRLNGILNVGKTVDSAHPVWVPIHREAYERYSGGANAPEDRDELAAQIMDVLCAVRNNTFHGGKRADDANDEEVLVNAIPLLKMIVQSFVGE